MKYRFIDDLTSDVMFEAYGKTLKEVFANAGEALFSVICQIDQIKEKKTREVEVKGTSLEDLMFNWLQELIVLVDTDEMFFSKFEILEVAGDGSYLKARCFGEEADPAKGGVLVKAVTYYGFVFEKTGEGYRVRISLDI